MHLSPSERRTNRTRWSANCLIHPPNPRTDWPCNKTRWQGLALPALPPNFPILLHDPGHGGCGDEKPIRFASAQVFEDGAPLFPGAEVDVRSFPAHGFEEAAFIPGISQRF